MGEQYECPRCGLIGNHLKSAVLTRCTHCLAVDASWELLLAVREAVRVLDTWHEMRDDGTKAVSMLRHALYLAEEGEPFQEREA